MHCPLNIVRENQIKNSKYYSYKYIGNPMGDKLYEETFHKELYDKDQLIAKDRQLIIDKTESKKVDDKIVYEKIIDIKPNEVIGYSVRVDYDTRTLNVIGTDKSTMSVNWKYDIINWFVNENNLVYREVDRSNNEQYDRTIDITTGEVIGSRSVVLEERSPDYIKDTIDPEDDMGSDSGGERRNVYSLWTTGNYDEGRSQDFEIDLNNSIAEPSNFFEANQVNMFGTKGILANLTTNTSPRNQESYWIFRYFNYECPGGTYGEVFPFDKFPPGSPGGWTSFEQFQEFENLCIPPGEASSTFKPIYYNNHKHYLEFTFEPTDEGGNDIVFETANQGDVTFGGGTFNKRGAHQIRVRPESQQVEFYAMSADDGSKPSLYYGLSGKYDLSSTNKYTARYEILPLSSIENGDFESYVELYINGTKLNTEMIRNRSLAVPLGHKKQAIYDHHKIQYDYDTFMSVLTTNFTTPLKWQSQFEASGKGIFGTSRDLSGQPFGLFTSTTPGGWDFNGKVSALRMGVIGTDKVGDTYHLPLTTTETESLSFTELINGKALPYRRNYDIQPGSSSQRFNRVVKIPLWSINKPKFTPDSTNIFDQSALLNLLQTSKPTGPNFGGTTQAMYLCAMDNTPLVRRVGADAGMVGNDKYIPPLNDYWSNTSSQVIDPRNHLDNPRLGITRTTTYQYPAYGDIDFMVPDAIRNPDCFAYSLFGNDLCCVANRDVYGGHPFVTPYVILLSPHHGMIIAHVRVEYPASTWRDGSRRFTFTNLSNQVASTSCIDFVDMSDVRGKGESNPDAWVNWNEPLAYGDDNYVQKADATILLFNNKIELEGIPYAKFFPEDFLYPLEQFIDTDTNPRLYHFLNQARTLKEWYQKPAFMVGPSRESVVTVERLLDLNSGFVQFPEPDDDLVYDWSRCTDYFNDDQKGSSGTPLFIPHGNELGLIGLADTVPKNRNFSNGGYPANNYEITYPELQGGGLRVRSALGSSSTSVSLMMIKEFQQKVQEMMNKLSDDNGYPRYTIGRFANPPSRPSLTFEFPISPKGTYP